MVQRVSLLVSLWALALFALASSRLAAAPPGPTTPVPPPSGTTSNAPSTVVLSGHGYGHGMGMGQWGAYGFARHGWRYDAILTHYYRGTTLGLASPRTLRVLLAEGKRRVALESSAPWRVVDAEGARVRLPPGELLIGRAIKIRGKILVPPLTFSGGSGEPLRYDSTRYRGTLVVSRTGSKLQVVNRVGLEAYLRGVVPAEVPAWWPAEALKAQAVAARSYALASLATETAASTYDLFGDTRSQVYGGLSAEDPATTAAIDDTALQVVLYDGKVATTYFSSSSGGRTVSAAEATGNPVPYLVSVNDPYDHYATYHDWGPVLFDADKVAKAVGLKGSLLDLQAVRGPSQHVTKVTAVGEGSQVVVTGPALRFGLGLRSAWFTVGWLALSPVPAPVGFGASVTLAGIGRGLSGLTLEQKPAGGEWQRVSAVTPDAAGTFTTRVTPDVTTSYRLTSGELRGALITVAVAPMIQAKPRIGGVEGTIQPALEGSPVQLQRQSGTAWTTIATGTADAAGTFTLALPVPTRPGSYRIRSAPGRGLSPGVSLPLALS